MPSGEFLAPNHWTRSGVLATPGVGGAAVTPNDSTDLPLAARFLIIGVAGNVKITTIDGSVLTLAAPAGIFPVTAVRVWATGTTATGITAMW